MRSRRTSALKSPSSEEECRYSELSFTPFKAEAAAVMSFDCGNDELNEFLRTNEVMEFEREHLGKTTLVYCRGELAGYYTIYADSLERTYVRKHSSLSIASAMHVKSIPAIMVGRLAVDVNGRAEESAKQFSRELLCMRSTIPITWEFD